MKLSICGKGGCGKSTISALIASGLKKMGNRVLVVDADESNFGLHQLLGLPLPENVMAHLGGKHGFQEKMAQFQKQTQEGHPGFFKEKWTVDGIPEDYVMSGSGIKLLLVGKIHSFAEGCACPMGMLSKMILSNITPGDDEVVVVDTEAGTEHFGRGLEGECDEILAVVDPTQESFRMARKIEAMGEKANRPVWFLLNKTNADLEPIMSRHLGDEKVIGRIPANEQLFMASLTGSELDVDLPEIGSVCRFLVDSVALRKKAGASQ